MEIVVDEECNMTVRSINYLCYDKSEEKRIYPSNLQIPPSTSYQQAVEKENEHSLISSNKQSVVRDNEKTRGRNDKLTKEAFDASAEESSGERDESNG